MSEDLRRGQRDSRAMGGTPPPDTARTAVAVAADRLRRRFASRRFVVLLAVYAAVLLTMTVLSSAVAWAMSALSNGLGTGPLVFSAVIFTVLLLTVAAGPAVQGRAITAPAFDGSASRRTSFRPPAEPQGTRAVVFGALLAEWVTSLAFLAIALPVVLVTAIAGAVPPLEVVVSIAVLLAEVLLLGAIAVGISGLIDRPGWAVAAAYATVGALTVGSLVAFGVVGNLAHHEVVTESRGVSWSSTDLVADCDDAFAQGASDCEEDADGEGVTVCDAWQSTSSVRPRLDLAWWLLVPNPFVLVADATPPSWEGPARSPVDLFGMVTAGVRQAQLAGEPTEIFDSCTIDGQDRASTVPALLERTASSWHLGLLVQGGLATVLLAGAAARRVRR